MTKILIVAGFDKSLLLFRKELIISWLNMNINVVASAPGESVRETLNEMGVKYYSIPLNRTSLNPIGDLFLLFKIWAIIFEEKPDYIFLYTIKPVIYGSLASFARLRCSVFSMITGLGYAFTETAENGSKKSLKSLITCLYRIGLKKNDKVFFQNPDDLDLFVKQALVKPENAVLVKGSGVNLEFFKPVVLPEEPIVFLLIARLLKEKGIAEYFMAAKLVKTKYPQVVFKLVGWQLEGGASGIEDKEIEGWRKSGIAEISGETTDVRPFIASASVYVLPSYREGTPRTVLEAMAMGRPIITTEVPGCRETVEEGVNGYLVPVKDSRALAEAMERFIMNPELVERMGKESRRIAEEKFDVHKVNRVINEAMGLL